MRQVEVKSLSAHVCLCNNGMSGPTVVRQRDFDATIGQRVVSDRNLACAGLKSKYVCSCLSL